MNRLFHYLVLTLILIVSGCATAPEVMYVADAQEVTAPALEPVSIDSAQLQSDLTKRFAKRGLADKSNSIASMVSEQIARTKRFTVEQTNMSVGKNYIILPGIDDLPEPSIINIPTDPTRKKVVFKARVRLDVKSIDSNGTERKHKSYSDSRVNEMRVSIKNLPLTQDQKAEYYYETIEVGFKAAANLLGVAFNPSFVFGTVSKVTGKTAHVNDINTSKLQNLPHFKRKAEILDKNNPNLVIAVIDSFKIDRGTISGTFYEKGGSVSEGAKVRVVINDLKE